VNGIVDTSVWSLSLRRRAPRGTPPERELAELVREGRALIAGPVRQEIARLRRIYGRGRWRKRKGIARLRLSDGTIRTAEIHWYEAHGIARKEVKIKRFLP
jgi:hypothetical protein